MFITFEGGEGVSKTTQAKLLQQYFITKGHNVILTREPGGTQFGEEIRKIVLTTELAPITDLLAMMAARSEHITQVIKPALEQKTIVICDRFVDSTACYQTNNTNITINKVYELHQNTFGDFLPDITILLNLHPNIALQRAKARNSKNVDKMEAQDLAYHIKIYERYVQLAKTFPQRIHIVDAEGTIEQIHQRILNVVKGISS